MLSSGRGRPAGATPATPATRRKRFAYPFRTLTLWGLAITAVVLAPAMVGGPLVRLLPFLVFLPAFVAGVGTVWQTVAAAAWALFVVLATLGHRGEITDSPIAVTFTAAFGVLSVLVGWYRVRRDEEAERLRFREEEVSRLRSAAAELQRSVLRPLPQRTEHAVVDGRYRPIEEDSTVGGDIYEVVDSPHGTRVLVADVQGKGLPAIGAAVSVLGAFRTVAYRSADLEAVVEALEDAVTQHNALAAQLDEPERFVTALLLDIGAGSRVRAVNCGHVPPCLVSPERVGHVLHAEPGLPLGLGSLVPGTRTVEDFELPPGAALVVCTDGVTEARDAAGVFYPLTERLSAWAGDVPVPRLAETLAADLRRYTGEEFRDDVTLLVVRRDTR